MVIDREVDQSKWTAGIRLTLNTFEGFSRLSFSLSFPFSLTLSEVVVPPTEVWGCDVPLVGGRGEPEAVCVKWGLAAEELEELCFFWMSSDMAAKVTDLMLVIPMSGCELRLSDSIMGHGMMASRCRGPGFCSWGETSRFPSRLHDYSLRGPERSLPDLVDKMTTVVAIRLLDQILSLDY
jgi:hypothetical protein